MAMDFWKICHENSGSCSEEIFESQHKLKGTHTQKRNCSNAISSALFFSPSLSHKFTIQAEEEYKFSVQIEEEQKEKYETLKK